MCKNDLINLSFRAQLPHNAVYITVYIKGRPRGHINDDLAPHLKQEPVASS